MRRVYKYPLSLSTADQRIEMPMGARIVHVHSQDERPCLWAEVDPTSSPVLRQFRVYATGESVLRDRVYVGTVHVGWTVWHIFEEPF